MKSYNIFYINQQLLKKFIIEHKIYEEKNILVQIFSGNTDRVYIENIIKSLKNFLPHVKIIGTTTDGEICNDTLSTNKVVLSFSLFENTKIITSYYNKTNDPTLIARKLFNKIPLTNNLKLLITFTEGLHINGEEYLKSIENIKSDLIVAGGLAGDNGNFLQTYIFTEDGVFEKGAVGAFFYNSNLEVNNEYIFGWEKIGKGLKITKAYKNIVYTIDNIPAKEVYEKYLGKDFLIKAMEFPLIIYRDGVKVARAVLNINDDGSLLFAGNISEGDEVFFSYGNIDDILQMNLEKYQNINNKPIEAFFIYSCMARRRLIGEEIKKEILPLAYTAPTAGFFTYGELYHNKNEHKNELLNQTMTILSISEKISAKKKIDDFSNIPKESETKITTIQALLNLISETQNELNRLNRTLEKKVEEKTKELKHRYYTNPITELKNDNALNEAIENKKSDSLIILDIDNFNFYNEIYGPQEGNNILKNLANYLSKNLDKDIYDLYHFHTDQFAILLKVNLYDEHYIAFIALELLHIVKKFRHYIKNTQESISIDITLGIAKSEKHLIQKAMIALAHAKKNKKDFVNYSIELENNNDSKNIIYWKDEIKKAIQQDNIIPFFQPIIDKNKNIVKYEVLMRLRQVEKDGKYKLVSPFFFLDIAIKTKQYPKLTKIIIEKVFKEIKNFKQKFSINLLFEDIINQEIKELLIENIIKYNIGDKLIFEIVESSNVDDYNKVKKFISEFKRYGVEIAIDDFGSGFSNYMHILEIEPDYIKLDGSLIKNIDKSKKAYEFIKSIVNLSKALSIKTIAEFIHSKEVFEVCKSIGIDQYQGYYFYEPLRLEEIKDMQGLLKLEYV